jgi:hypothetical protein
MNRDKGEEMKPYKSDKYVDKKKTKQKDEEKEILVK